MLTKITTTMAALIAAAIMAIPLSARAHEAGFLPPAPQSHRAMHRDLNREHRTAHLVNPYMTPRQHRRLHRYVSREHQQYHHRAW